MDTYIPTQYVNTHFVLSDLHDTVLIGFEAQLVHKKPGLISKHPLQAPYSLPGHKLLAYIGYICPNRPFILHSEGMQYAGLQAASSFQASVQIVRVYPSGL